MVYHTKCDYIISLDKKGVFNYWKPRDGSIPKQDLKYKFQVATDLYLFKKNQVVPLSLSISKGCKWMGVFANDWKVHHTFLCQIVLCFGYNDRQTATVV